MLKAAKPRRTKAEQVRYEATIHKIKSRRLQATLTGVSHEKKPTTQKVKEARARRLAHHWKYLEDQLKKVKEVMMVSPEDRGKKRIAEKKVQDAHTAELARLVAKRYRLIHKRNLSLKREEKRLAIKRMKDAQMARSITLRKALESIERRLFLARKLFA